MNTIAISTDVTTPPLLCDSTKVAELRVTSYGLRVGTSHFPLPTSKAGNWSDLAVCPERRNKMNHEIHEKHEKFLFRDESYAIQGGGLVCWKLAEHQGRM